MLRNRWVRLQRGDVDTVAVVFVVAVAEVSR